MSGYRRPDSRDRRDDRSRDGDRDRDRDRSGGKPAQLLPPSL